jgi:hypothetical protein
MSIEWLGSPVEDRDQRRRQVVLTEFQLGHLPAFRQVFIDHFGVVGRELPQDPGYFRGPSGGLYEVALTARSGAPVPAGLEIAAIPTRFAPLNSGEVNTDLWAFLDWLLERVGPPWTPQALSKIAAIYRIPEGQPGSWTATAPDPG